MEIAAHAAIDGRLQSPEFGQAAEEREAADIGDVIGVPDKEDLAGDALPLMLSHILYIFESNVRSLTILGIVGAAGIGFLRSDRIWPMRWDEASFIILMILAAVALIDTGSAALRRRLLQA